MGEGAEQPPQGRGPTAGGRGGSRLAGGNIHDELEETENKGGIGKTWLLREFHTILEQQEQVVPVKIIDFFNVLNNPNNPTGIGADGIQSTRNSGSAGRVTQLTLRLIW